MFPIETMHSDRVRAIDAWLPQTQCTRCGYPDCRAYAEAIAHGQAGINRCPPGGEATLAGLAQLLGVPAMPLDPEVGAPRPRERAVIDEARCIGCRKCIEACPVDAIVGARKFMHTVIAAQCTGCELCLPPCPVDCILLIAAAAAGPPGRWPEFTDDDVARARWRAESRRARLAHGPAADIGRRADSARKKAEIRAAVARVRAKRAARPAIRARNDA